MNPTPGVPWDRRQWLTTQLRALTAMMAAPALRGRFGIGRAPSSPSHLSLPRALSASHAERLDPAPWEALAQQAVDAAHAAGAQYADARLTRIVQHEYGCNGAARFTDFRQGIELIGVGVRALVQGYWGFAASAVPVADEVVRLARDAVAQARTNAQGTPRTVDFGHYPVARGTWTTPIRLDPFVIPIEEKEDFILFWCHCADRGGVPVDPNPSFLQFVRQERVVATSDGALFTQTFYETGGRIVCRLLQPDGTAIGSQLVHGLETAGVGWELLLDAQLPEQFASGRIRHELAQQVAIPRKPHTVGKYTLVCDGATMAALAERTLGVATQLDRALGYEANAQGTSFIDDPLGMVGREQVTAPLVTFTGNRSAPRELATVKWDDEGVVPQPFTLIKDGVLVDFQTTREQASWLKPYYARHGQLAMSHGCANSEDAHGIPLQMLPNLTVEPGPSSLGLDDLIADVKDGILLAGGDIAQIDSQARTGLLLAGDYGCMQEIKNGRLGRILTGGAVFFNSQQLWKSLTAIGGPTTQAVLPRHYPTTTKGLFANEFKYRKVDGKGQPLQLASHSIQGVAATIPNQPVIDPMRKI